MNSLGLQTWLNGRSRVGYDSSARGWIRHAWRHTAAVLEVSGRRKWYVARFHLRNWARWRNGACFAVLWLRETSTSRANSPGRLRGVCGNLGAQGGRGGHEGDNSRDGAQHLGCLLGWLTSCDTCFAVEGVNVITPVAGHGQLRLWVSWQCIAIAIHTSPLGRWRLRSPVIVGCCVVVAGSQSSGRRMPLAPTGSLRGGTTPTSVTTAVMRV